MSEQVEERLAVILDDVSTDPFGNPIPPQTAEHPRPSANEASTDRLASRETTTAVISRIGEPVQADTELITTSRMRGSWPERRWSCVRAPVGCVLSERPAIPSFCRRVARHLFVRR